MDYYKVEGHANLIKDKSTGAILNTDVSEYNNYIALRNLKQNENEKIKSLESDVQNIQSDLKEIKTLLRSFINESR